MDAHRKLLACVAIMVMVSCSFVPMLPAQESTAVGDADGVLLYEVDPQSKSDAVSIKNFGKSDVNIKDYSIKDNSGTLRIVKPFILKPGDSVVIAVKNDTTDSIMRGNILTCENKEEVIKSNSYDLAKGGDTLYLYDPSGNVLDAMCYGNKTITDTSLWTGPAASTKSGFFLERVSTYDSDSSDDWFPHIPGLSDFEFDPDNPIEADKVTPFLFPDSGGIPIYEALESAKESVYIEIYELRSENIHALLCELEGRGVDVTLLLEGAPTARPVTTDSGLIAALIESGGEVRTIGGTDTDRYENMHAKYAVIDGEKVIITSENWTAANCNGKIDNDPYSGDNGNRGWGAVIEDREYASYMMDVFNNDYSMEYGDVKVYKDEYPYITPVELTYTEPQRGVEFKSYYNVDIVPVLSNDNSYVAMEYYISNAEERVYAQNQSLSSYYADLGEKSPVMMMAKRANDLKDTGFESKFILSGGFNSDDLREANEQVLKINTQTLVSAAVMKQPYVHNKGLICDDVSWVSSINWTPTSVEYNREACVAIHDKDIAAFFAEAFQNDFERNYNYDGFRVDTSGIQKSYESGKPVKFSVNVMPENDDYTFTWDLGDGSAPITTSIPYISAEPLDGAHVLTITVVNGNGVKQTATVDYYIGEGGGSQDTGSPDLDSLVESYGKYLVPLIVVILAIIGALARSSRSRKRKG